MNRAALIAVIAIAVALSGAVATTAYAAHSIYSAGAVQVSVSERGPGGCDVFVWAPAFLIDLAAPFAALAIPEQAKEEMEPWMPVASVATAELAALPDCVLVEVRSRSEHVRVSKSGNHLLVDVETASESVHVQVPLRSVAHLMRRLERAV